MRRRKNQKKEKFIMLASSLFVLSALTLTGVYVKERTKIQNENSVDFSQMENSATEKAAEIQKQEDLALQEANASKAVNPTNRYQYSGVPVLTQEETEEQTQEAEENNTIPEEETQESKETSATAAKMLSFSEEEGLTWPIVGNVLINYSMDKTVYFSTLQQYKYSPAIVIAATEGENIAAAADGVVSKVYYDAQTGNSVCVDLGDGYELTYGQLNDIYLAEGDFVTTGEIIGNVAAPTKYYSVEGANVYFKLTKNGEPINPLNRLL